MDVIPAIDLRDGRCVRLHQGDYERQTVYSDAPSEVAARWADLGATRLHVVDLDAARDGGSANLSVVGDIVSAAAVPVQLGGGLRTVEAARAAVALGVDRVIVGTAAVESPSVVESMCRHLGSDSVVVGVDARDGLVAVHGWTQTTGTPAADLVEQMTGLGVQRFLYTDIARDGTLTEPNFRAIEALANCTKARLIAAGGISSVCHLRRLAGLGIEAAIVGKALYTGAIDLDEAIQALRKER